MIRWMKGEQTIDPIEGYEGLIQRHAKTPLTPGSAIWMARSKAYVMRGQDVKGKFGLDAKGRQAPEGVVVDLS